MSWTQVYITGLTRSLEPSDEDIEKLLDARYELASDPSVLWAGSGTTLVKRDDHGLCRGFAFLAFYSAAGASAVVDRINTFSSISHEGKGTSLAEDEGNDGVGEHENDSGEDESKKLNSTVILPLQLHAELSNPKAKKDRSQKKEKHVPDLRLRRQRTAPTRKHPVITSSDKKRTNLGNKTK